MWLNKFRSNRSHAEFSLLAYAHSPSEARYGSVNATYAPRVPEVNAQIQRMFEERLALLLVQGSLLLLI
jgi:hypothetical protein